MPADLWFSAHAEFPQAETSDWDQISPNLHLSGHNVLWAKMYRVKNPEVVAFSMVVMMSTGASAINLVILYTLLIAGHALPITLVRDDEPNGLSFSGKRHRY
jgi:hypothetical protein